MENAVALWRLYSGDMGRPIQTSPLITVLNIKTLGTFPREYSPLIL